MVKMFKMNKVELETLNKKMVESIEENKNAKNYFTLEEYASEFFNLPTQETSKSGVISNVSKSGKKIPIWAKESEPIKNALLQSGIQMNKLLEEYIDQYIDITNLNIDISVFQNSIY